MSTSHTTHSRDSQGCGTPGCGCSDRAVDGAYSQVPFPPPPACNTGVETPALGSERCLSRVCTGAECTASARHWLGLFRIFISRGYGGWVRVMMTRAMARECLEAVQARVVALRRHYTNRTHEGATRAELDALTGELLCCQDLAGRLLSEVVK